MARSISCKWCFHLKYLTKDWLGRKTTGLVRCKKKKWERIYYPEFSLSASYEFKKKAGKCKYYDCKISM